MPPETDSRVTVAVITHNRRAELARTLDRLEDLPERPAVIVVDNGSADGSAAYVRWHYPAVTLITARTNLGAVGRNLALRRVTTPYAAFSDDDTWWDPGSLTLAADRRAGRHGAARRGIGGRVPRCRARPALGAARTPTGGTRP